MKAFWTGIRALFYGFAFVVTKPSVWGWALVPVLVAATLFFGIAGAAIWLVTTRMLAPSAWGDVALKIVLSLIAIVIAFLIAFSLAQPIAGFALERVARAQHREIGGAPWSKEGVGFWQSLGVSLTALVLSTPIVALLSAVTLVAPPASVVTFPLKFMVTGLAVAWDFLDYPLTLQGAGIRARLAFVRGHFTAVLGFGLASALLLLVPGISLLLLPIGVAGATRLVNELAERPRDV